MFKVLIGANCNIFKNPGCGNEMEMLRHQYET
jgi:hypothetical protein